MGIDDVRKKERMGPFGVPLWAWGSGLAIGFSIGILLFDGPVAYLFAASIGTAFAMAFSGSTGRAARDDGPGEKSETPGERDG